MVGNDARNAQSRKEKGQGEAEAHCLARVSLKQGTNDANYREAPGSVRLRFGGGTIPAVPVFGSGGSSVKKVFLCFSTV